MLYIPYVIQAGPTVIMKAHPGLAWLRAAVQDDTQVGGFQGPLRYRLAGKLLILRGRGWSWRHVYGFNFCFFKLKGEKKKKRHPEGFTWQESIKNGSEYHWRKKYICKVLNEPRKKKA